MVVCVVVLQERIALAACSGNLSIPRPKTFESYRLVEWRNREWRSRRN